MSDNPNDPNPAAEPSSEAPTGGEPAEPSTPVSEPAPPAYVYGQDSDVPAYLKGKTREQLAGDWQNMYSALVNQSGLPQQYGQPQAAPAYSQQPAPPAPTYGAAQPPVTSQPAPAVTNETYLDNPVGAVNTLVSQGLTDIQAQQQAFMQQQYQANADMAKTQARLARKDEYDRWGPEIEVELSRVNPQFLSPQLISQAIDMVKGRHASEIQNEVVEARAKELLEKRGVDLLRTGAGGVAPPTSEVLHLNDSNIPEEKRLRFKELGVTDNMLDNMLHKVGDVTKHGSLEAARKAYLEKLSSGQAIAAGASS